MFDIIIFFGAGISLAFALGILFQSPKILLTERLISFFLFFSICSWMTWSGILFAGRMQEFVLINPFGLPFIFATGPLLYWYFSMLMSEKFSFSYRYYFHLLPSIILFFLFVFDSLSAEPRYIPGQFLPVRFSSNSLQTMVSFFASLSLNLYTLATMKKYSFLVQREYASDRKLLYAGLIMIFSAIGALLSLVALVAGNLPLLALSNVTVTLNLLLVYVVSRKYPELVQNIAAAAMLQKYSKSTLDNVDTARIEKELLLLMQQDKIYCDEDLSLGSLAEELEISPHQLSELLNTRLKKNFKTFVNEYRVDEAKRILLSEPERSSLSVAMAAGFNSVTVFHAVFKKTTGTSPGNFRKIQK